MIGLILPVGLLVIGGVILFVKFCSTNYQLADYAVGEEPPPPRFVLFPRLQRSQSPGEGSERASLLSHEDRVFDLPSYSSSPEATERLDTDEELDESSGGGRSAMAASDVIAVLALRAIRTQSNDEGCHDNHHGDCDTSSERSDTPESVESSHDDRTD